ncbi:MAG TPA: hypothetical protein VFR87_03165 [Nocardioidaceae bacterium]|nr:hypothetical protein [Nocardioidaceae bacterium]
MTTVAAPRATKRPSVAARRTGYLIAVGINVLLLWLANVQPGWEALPFLTSDMEQVMPLVNASLIAGAVANVVYLAADPKWLKALGDIVTTVVGIVAMVKMWQVFPFDFGDASFDWALLFRWVLGVGIVGSAISILVNLVSLVSGTRSRS